jgi:hypothetical protein
VHNYRGPGIYRHYKGGLYDIVGLALWEPMAGKKNNEPGIGDAVASIAENLPDGPSKLVLMQAAELLSEPLFVIYEPMSTGSMLRDLPGVKFWARAKADFDADVNVPDKDSTIARFTFKTGIRDGEIK